MNKEELDKLFAIGVSYTQKKDYPKAIKYFQQYLDTAPTDDINYNNALLSIGLAYACTENYPKVIKYFQQYLDTTPKTDKNYNEVLFSLGLAYHEISNYSEAIKYWEQYLDTALKSDKNYNTALYGIGFCYDECKKFRQAIKYWEQYLDTAPKSDKNYNPVLYNIGFCYDECKEYHQAIECWEQYLGNALKDDKIVSNLYIRISIAQLNNLDLLGAVTTVKNAIKDYPENNLYYKLLGDILLQQKSFNDSILAYLDYLKFIDDGYDLFKEFIRFYTRLKSESKEYALILKNQLISNIDTNIYSLQVREWLLEYFKEKKSVDTISQKNIDCYNDSTLKKFIGIIKKMEKEHQNLDLYAFLEYCINRKRTMKTKSKDKYIVSVLERHRKFTEALKLTEQLIEIDKDSILTRAIFRICRIMNDYSFAEKIINKNPDILKKENFNTLYELFYYYRSRNDIDNVKRTLERIRKTAKESIPISKTLYNFYIQLGMIDSAKEIQEHIKKLSEAKSENSEEKFPFNEIEYETITDLLEDQEHNRQMNAINELLIGFSHEVGQPITNIRYAIQFYQMKDKKDKITVYETQELLGSILKQTERIGRLVKRFSPILSQKGDVVSFSIQNRFRQVFEDLKDRLGTIQFTITEGDIFLDGDPMQFDQIIYNLILNAIHAISQTDHIGKIEVEVYNESKSICINFSDNGSGIEEKNMKKIFDPFFTTKDPSKGEGGEGMGLYIVWNIVKIFTGEVKLNKKYPSGTQFNLRFKVTSKNLNFFTFVPQ